MMIAESNSKKIRLQAVNPALQHLLLLQGGNTLEQDVLLFKEFHHPNCGQLHPNLQSHSMRALVLIFAQSQGGGFLMRTTMLGFCMYPHIRGPNFSVHVMWGHLGSCKGWDCICSKALVPLVFKDFSWEYREWNKVEKSRPSGECLLVDHQSQQWGNRGLSPLLYLFLLTTLSPFSLLLLRPSFISLLLICCNFYHRIYKRLKIWTRKFFTRHVHNWAY